MLLGFKKRFEKPILIGTKVHTLRDKRKVQPKIGEVMYMYSGLRTKYSKLISKNEKLISTQKLWIRMEFEIKPIVTLYLKICIDGRVLSEKEIDKLVKFDGFESVTDFTEFWIEGVIKEKKLKKQLGYFVMTCTKTMYHWTDLRY